jgi:protein-export membrane protein SecD
MSIRRKIWIKFWLVVILFLVAAFVAWPKPISKPAWLGNIHNKLKINLGLDLQGGIHLVYKVDTSGVEPAKVQDALSGLQDVIERRVNAFGVAEPVIETAKSGGEQRLIVELAGVRDIEAAKEMIKETPFLEFKKMELAAPPEQADQNADSENQIAMPVFTDTGLTGKNLKSANVQFMSQSGKPEVGIEFDSEGAKQFSDLTKENVGKQIAIFLDGQVISAPTVQTQITDGKAVITGNFTLDEAKQLAQRLNEGALPVPISLIGQQSVQASLGQISLVQSLKAGFIGIILVMVFMILYYRFLGFIASAALVIYSSLMVAIFKISTVTPWSITLTLAGIAGFILSVGMAVDANILIFERTKEEIRHGRGIRSAIDEGFHRAWPSIRDSNISTIITSLILIWFGTGFVKGFAVTLLLGVLVSMFTAIVLVRTILTAVVGNWAEEKESLIIAKTKRKNSSE